jgi:glutamine amidotransferase
MWAFRYSSEGKSRSLFFTGSVPTLRALYPENQTLHEMSDDARLIVSEPVGNLPGAWHEVPESSYGVVGGGDDQMHSFQVKPPVTAVPIPA